MKDAEQTREAIDLFAAEVGALGDAAEALLAGELSAAVLVDAATVLTAARVALHELAVRAKGPPPQEEYATTADALLALAFGRAHVGLLQAIDGVRLDPVGLDVGGLARLTRGMERLSDEFRALLASRGRPHVQAAGVYSGGEPAGPLRVFRGDEAG